MSFETVTYEKDGLIARVTLNRPDKLNAINDAMLRDVTAAFAEAQRDPEVRILILKGAGRCFSVGQDLSGVGTSEVMPSNLRSKPYLSDLYQQAMSNCLRWQAFFDFPKWSIAQVHGYCLGAAWRSHFAAHIMLQFVRFRPGEVNLYRARKDKLLKGFFAERAAAATTRASG